MTVTRTALITGVAGGIGRALARRFLDDGYSVVGADVHVPESADLQGIHFINLDLHRFCQDVGVAARFFAEVARHMPSARLDVLINNAATQVVEPIERITREDWQRVMDVNVTAPFLLVQGLLESLVNAHGSVINIASIHARLTKPGFSAYATSKAALSGLTRALAVELGARVRVNGIAPAAIATPMLKVGFEGQPDQYALLESHHPSARIGSPQEVAAVAAWLASKECPFLNGAVVGLDGGIGARLHDPA